MSTVKEIKESKRQSQCPQTSYFVVVGKNHVKLY